MANKNITILIIIILIAAVGFKFFGGNSIKGISPEEAQAKVQELIDMNPDNPAVIKEVVEEGGVYKITVVLEEQEFYSYLSKDGAKFFPEAIDLEEISNLQKDAPKQEVSAKSNKPTVELFVMSHCPYGTQIEKGILPVVETLGDKIDFELKFCDYAMHGEPELDEQLNQYCIQKEQGDKFLSYLTCFLEDSDSSRCVTKVGVNKSKMDSCVAKTDKEFKVKELFADKSTWQGGSYPVFNVYKDDNTKYSVGGSPTLIINGEQISSGRDSASLLGAICSGFNEAPEQCNTDLSSTSPSPGFGIGAATGGGSAAATCN